ncbi:MAG: CPBP family intramembrane metalloprotease [Armatimonadetes bacterium]|nr:CPBP family intramembrane metalloprotease [Armatimonadota bacterium]
MRERIEPDAATPPVLVADAGTPAAAPWRIPASLWVWLAVLVATYALPQLLAVRGSGEKMVRESGLSSASFQRLGQAEYLTRVALVPEFASSPQIKTTPPAQTAANIYREVAQQSGSVASARKAFVLDALQKKPLDEKLLTGAHAQNLSKRGARAGDISTELAFWRSLYGADKTASFSPDEGDAAIARVKTYNLGILEGQTIADIYTRTDRPADAKRVAKAMQTKATGEVLRLVGLIVALLCAALMGLVFWAMFLSSVRSKRWETVGRIRLLGDLPGTAPNGGALLDVFVAYLAMARGIGLLVGSAPALDGISPIALSAGVYVGSGILAFYYLLYQTRRNGWNLSGLGLRPVKPAELWYGVAGYCAALPLTFALGYINTQVFKDSQSSLTPNPVLPMIAGEGSIGGRVVLFLLVAIAAPVIEELFFRGVLYSALKTRFSTVACVLLSGACFAVVHPMGDWLPIFGLGCLLGTVRELRQSIVPGIAVHFCQNAMAFVLMSSMFGR